MEQSPSINWQAQNIFSQIAEKIDKPLAEIVRLHKYILSERKDVDHRTKQLSSIILENSQQIEELVRDMIRMEESKQIEILVHDKFKFPEIYKFNNWQLSSSNRIGDYLSEDNQGTRISKVDLEWLISLENIILTHIDSYQLNIALLAKESMTSERQLFRRVEKFTGLTPNKYIREIRLYYAKQLLERYTFTTVNEVASAVGLKDPYYFSSLFKDTFGKKPKEYLN